MNLGKTYAQNLVLDNVDLSAPKYDQGESNAIYPEIHVGAHTNGQKLKGVPDLVLRGTGWRHWHPRMNIKNRSVAAKRPPQ